MNSMTRYHEMKPYLREIEWLGMGACIMQDGSIDVQDVSIVTSGGARRVEYETVRLSTPEAARRFIAARR